MEAALYTIYTLNCLFLILVVLLQAGRGGGLSIAGGGGGGASAQVFGARGGTTFLQKLTIGSAAGFMVLSIIIARISSSPDSADAGTFIDPEVTESEDGAAPAAGGDDGAAAAPAEDEAASDEATE
jgi:preprotein translocase subunit SecG